MKRTGVDSVYYYSTKWEDGTHELRASVMRRVLVDKILLDDGPKRAKLSRGATIPIPPIEESTDRKTWLAYAKKCGFVIPDEEVELLNDAYGPYSCTKRLSYGRSCDRGHLIPYSYLRWFATTKLGYVDMYGIEKVVEVEKVVEKIVEKIVPVEVPLALSFGQRETLTDALRREQHVANEYLRRAYLADDRAEVETWAARVRDTLAVMTMLGIEPAPWGANHEALVEAGLIVPTLPTAQLTLLPN